MYVMDYWGSSDTFDLVPRYVNEVNGFCHFIFSYQNTVKGNRHKKVLANIEYH